MKDPKEIAEYELLASPGLVINDKVKCSRKIPSKDDIKRWIEEENEQVNH